MGHLLFLFMTIECSRSVHSIVGNKVKTGRKILCSLMSSHFPPENREENPLLANELAFSSGKQGGLYD